MGVLSRSRLSIVGIFLACQVCLAMAVSIQFEDQLVPAGLSATGFFMVLGKASSGSVIDCFPRIGRVARSACYYFFYYDHLEDPEMGGTVHAKVSMVASGPGPVVVGFLNYQLFAEGHGNLLQRDAVCQPGAPAKLDGFIYKTANTGTHALSFPAQWKRSVSRDVEGRWVLTLMNCGPDAVVVSGSVHVIDMHIRVAYGPYASPAVHWAFLILHIGIGCGWLRHGWGERRRFYSLHILIAILLGVSIFECAVLTSLAHALDADTILFPNIAYMSLQAGRAYALKWALFYVLGHLAIHWLPNSQTDNCCALGAHATATLCSWLYVTALWHREEANMWPLSLTKSPLSRVVALLPVALGDSIFLAYALMMTWHFQRDGTELPCRRSMFKKLHSLALLCAILGSLSMVLKCAHFFSPLGNFGWCTKWLVRGGSDEFIGLLGLGGAAFITRPGTFEERGGFLGKPEQELVSDPDGEMSESLLTVCGRPAEDHDD